MFSVAILFWEILMLTYILGCLIPMPSSHQKFGLTANGIQRSHQHKVSSNSLNTWAFIANRKTPIRCNLRSARVNMMMFYAFGGGDRDFR
jgi:hypothetical protein